MSQHFEGSETYPSAPEVMGRFAEQAALSPATPPKDVFLAFHTAGNVVTFLLEQRRDMDKTIAQNFLHGMAGMYDTLFDKYLGFEVSDDQVGEIDSDADRLRADLEEQMGGSPPLLDLTNRCFEQYLKTLHPGVDPLDLNVRFAAFVDIAHDGVQASPDPAVYLELVSGGFLYGSSQLVGIAPNSEQAHALRVQAIPRAKAFMQE